MNVKAGGAQTGGAFTFIEWSAPAGFGPPLHVHGREDEAFYIIDGQISVECGAKRFTAGPGDFTFLPRGIPHTFLVTRGPVRGLQITAPAGFEEFIAEAGRPAQRPGLPEPAEPDIARLRVAAWRAVWAAMPNNPVMAARFAHLTTRQDNRLARQQARTACAAALLRWIHVVVTRRVTWDPAVAAGGTPLRQAA
jgi:mannose-6-phosphate isomerase-like protein (cupin superfamily)